MIALITSLAAVIGGLFLVGLSWGEGWWKQTLVGITLVVIGFVLAEEIGGKRSVEQERDACLDAMTIISERAGEQ